MSSSPHQLSSRLAGRTALVTGAGGGIGRAVALRLAAEGAAVVADDIRADAAEAVAKEIEAAGGRALPIVADVSRKDEVDRLFDTVESELGTVDVLINHAGRIDFARHFLHVDEEWWDTVIDTNLKSLYLCAFRAAWAMARAEGGVIVNTSSGGAARAHRGNAAYDAAKGGIEAFTRALAVDLAPYEIRVNAVAPGAIDVAPEGAVSAEELARRGASIPLGRVGKPIDLAGATAFLASDDSAYVTGQVLTVDGGMVAQQRNPEVDIFGLDKFPRIEGRELPLLA